MLSVISLLRAEARKQARLKIPYLGIVAVTVMASMWPHLMSYYTDFPSIRQQTGYEFVANAMISIATSIIPIFVVIFAATLVAAETSSGTIRYVLCRPITRVSLLTAKFLTAFFYAFLLMAAAAAVVAIIGAVSIGYGTERDAMLGPPLAPGEFWPEFFKGFVVALAPAFATAAFGMCLSVVFRNAGAAVGAAAGALVVLEPLKHMLQWGDFSLKDWLWTEYYATALNLVSRLAQRTPDLWNTPELWRAIIIPAVWIAVFAAISLVIMLRRDWGR